MAAGLRISRLRSKSLNVIFDVGQHAPESFWLGAQKPKFLLVKRGFPIQSVLLFAEILPTAYDFSILKEVILRSGNFFAAMAI